VLRGRRDPGREAEAMSAWCSGPCGRLLPPTAYGTRRFRGRVYRQSQCRGCHRVAERDRYRALPRRVKALVIARVTAGRAARKVAAHKEAAA
jgi:hypothetical protein